MTTRRPLAPSLAAVAASSKVCSVLKVPMPARIIARSPTASSTTRSRSAFSASEVVGDSPVVPLITSPSLPISSTR